MANVRSCLRRCNYVNKVYARVCAEKNEGYTSSNEMHEAMLEQLWRNLKPNVRRKGGRITKEWGEIGFQGCLHVVLDNVVFRSSTEKVMLILLL